MTIISLCVPVCEEFGDNVANILERGAIYNLHCAICYKQVIPNRMNMRVANEAVSHRQTRSAPSQA